ncbi:hypothetical protein BDQ94DRAFT_62107 [Aspergillus welwitschiae]|uniref:Uncharacterized protein n=1 Tax=Aspergillus welwitschiae TaxID=1341132 RepID=A0A3F3PW71_9EURO|nr:hypothetical protein BDQ94DRAFT_62107 [Aspergillus welwitschiae]RDH31133.1 hypothetical protein BDQ94DRAFT_62107 [Aspergillus welwitschiae]
MPRRRTAIMIRVLAPFISTTESLHIQIKWSIRPNRALIPHADRTYVLISSFNNPHIYHQPSSSLFLSPFLLFFLTSSSRSSNVTPFVSLRIPPPTSLPLYPPLNSPSFPPLFLKSNPSLNPSLVNRLAGITVGNPYLCRR